MKDSFSSQANSFGHPLGFPEKIRMHDFPSFKHKTAQLVCPLLANWPLMTLCSSGIPDTWGTVQPRCWSCFIASTGSSGKAEGGSNLISCSAFCRSFCGAEDRLEAC